VTSSKSQAMSIQTWSMGQSVCLFACRGGHSPICCDETHIQRSPPRRRRRLASCAENPEAKQKGMSSPPISVCRWPSSNCYRLHLAPKSYPECAARLCRQPFSRTHAPRAALAALRPRTSVTLCLGVVANNAFRLGLRRTTLGNSGQE